MLWNEILQFLYKVNGLKIDPSMRYIWAAIVKCISNYNKLTIETTILKPKKKKSLLTNHHFLLRLKLAYKYKNFNADSYIISRWNKN